MNHYSASKKRRAQTAIEYLLLLMAVVAVVLIGMYKYLPRMGATANIYYNRVVPGILGKAPDCGDGSCSGYETCERCPTDCGPC